MSERFVTKDVNILERLYQNIGGESMSIIYPQKPPMQPDKSVLEKLKESKDIDIGLWFTHDPAIYKDPSSGNYYFYGTGAVCQRS